VISLGWILVAGITAMAVIVVIAVLIHAEVPVDVVREARLDRIEAQQRARSCVRVVGAPPWAPAGEGPVVERHPSAAPAGAFRRYERGARR
jgi:hypothetical protein